jgi:hypothetical protein
MKRQLSAGLRKYVRGVLRWLTQSINVFLWPLLNWFFDTDKFGDEDEYTSSVLGKLEARGNKKACKVCDFLSWALRDPGHCLKSIERDEGSPH